MTHMAEGEGVILFCVIMTYGVQKSICDSSLKEIHNQEIHTIRIIFHKDNFSHIK